VDWEYKAEHPQAQDLIGIRRSFLRYLKAHATPASDLGDAVLILGELCSNAIKHAPGPLHTYLQWMDGKAVLRLRTFGPSFDLWHRQLSDSRPEEAESGRGLLIIGALARRFEKRRLPEAGAIEVSVWLGVSRRRGPVPQPYGRAGGL
jgi:anti-sigma regulatory factor (Ser/Thr protein kinase)